MATITVPAAADPITAAWGASVANAINGGPYTTWTPTLTFLTAGNLSVAYTTRVGVYYQIGRLTFAFFDILTSTFTHTTASSLLAITGFPITPGGYIGKGLCSITGYTKANYTHVLPHTAAGDASIYFKAGGSGQTSAYLAATDMPTAGTVELAGHVTFLAS